VATAYDSMLTNAAVHRSAVLTRVVLADELTLLREGLASIFEGTGTCEVVGQCPDGVTALRMIHELKPDLAFLDWHLPEMFTLEIARQVRAAGLPTKIGVLSARSDRKTVIEALRSGVSAFLLKSGSSRQIPEAVSQMLGGSVYISPSLNAEEIFQTDSKSEPADPFDTLSPREFQVFTLLVDGVRAKEIAARLGLSPKTIDTYRSSLMQKLEIFDVASLVKFAIQRSYVTSR
jgi:two-component system response regulator NreC